jgi:hypothetical protein
VCFPAGENGAAGSTPKAPTRSRCAGPVPSGILTSTPAATATPRNQTRTASSRDPARRSQPRTVAAGTPRLAPIRRCPAPSARAVNTAQIRSAAYALRKSTVTGNNTWVTVHARQRARRGRSRSLSPSICRARAYPQPPSTPTPHVGQPIPPAASRDSTWTGPLPSPSVPPSTTARHPARRPRLQRVPRTHQFLVTLTVHTNKINPATTPTATSAASMKNGHPPCSSSRDGQQGVPITCHLSEFGNNAARERIHVGLIVASFEAAFSPARARSICSNAYVATAGAVIVSPLRASESYR